MVIRNILGVWTRAFETQKTKIRNKSGPSSQGTGTILVLFCFNMDGMKARKVLLLVMFEYQFEVLWYFGVRQGVEFDGHGDKIRE